MKDLKAGWVFELAWEHEKEFVTLTHLFKQPKNKKINTTSLNKKYEH